MLLSGARWRHRKTFALRVPGILLGHPERAHPARDRRLPLVARLEGEPRKFERAPKTRAVPGGRDAFITSGKRHPVGRPRLQRRSARQREAEPSAGAAGRGVRTSVRCSAGGGSVPAAVRMRRLRRSAAGPSLGSPGGESVRRCRGRRCSYTSSKPACPQHVALERESPAAAFALIQTITEIVSDR